MPQKFESTILDLDKIPKDEWKHITINCPWTRFFKSKSLTINITSLKWTFGYDFRIRVTAHPEGITFNSKQIDIDDLHSLLGSLTDVPNL